MQKAKAKYANFMEKLSSVTQLTAKLVLNCKNSLGECPIWDDEQQLLCWIDHLSKTFWTYDPKTKEAKSYLLPEMPGSFCLLEKAEPGTYLFAFENGPAFYNVLKDNSIDENKRIFDFEPQLNTKMNDGRVDREGRFVVGGMIKLNLDLQVSKYNKIVNTLSNIYTLFFGHKSAVYRINGDLTHEIIINNVGCTNSICFGLDGSSMFFTDSYAFLFDSKIIQFEYFSDERKPCTPAIKHNAKQMLSKKSGPIPRGEVFTKDCILPDGATIDSEGFLWSAQCGQSKVIRYDMNGNMNMVVNVGETHVTCCCFGGENMDTLYISTLDGVKLGAAKPKSAEQITGALYAIQLESIRGCKENRFRSVKQIL